MKGVLLIDDDELFARVMAEAFSRRGFQTLTAHSAEEAHALVQAQPVECAVVDLRMPEESGLQLIPALLHAKPKLRIVVLTGYASIATAVEAIKLGARHYLTKPADVDDIIAAFGREGGDDALAVTDTPTSLERLEWEYIHKTLNECGGNVSLAAKRLGLHRRTLQRKLQKRPPGLA